MQVTCNIYATISTNTANKMAKDTKTQLEIRFKKLPRDVNYIDAIIKAGISERTFHYDKKRDPNSIPFERLNVYAGLLDCQVDDLINTYSKVKPIMNRKRTKVGLKK